MDRNEAARIRAQEWFETDGWDVWDSEYRTVSFLKKHEWFWWNFGRDVIGVMNEAAGVGNYDVSEEEAVRFCNTEAIRFIDPMQRFLQDIEDFFYKILPDVNTDDRAWRKQWKHGVRRKVTYANAIWLVPMMEWYREWCIGEGRDELAVVAEYYVDELKRQEERAFLQAVYDLIQENPRRWS